MAVSPHEEMSLKMHAPDWISRSQGSASAIYATVTSTLGLGCKDPELAWRFIDS